MTAGELAAALQLVPADTPVKIAYEMFAQADVDPDATGESDGVFWVVVAE